MSKIYITITAVVLSSVLIITCGCESDAQTGALIGGAVGAGAGQAIGRNTESTLIGGAIGAGAGYLIGNQQDKKKTQAQTESVREEANTVTVNVTNSNGSVSQVKLKKQGVGYIGPKGEYYAQLPTEEQLKPVYGF
jgi:outer membrane lipoprotein SlyB